MTSPSVKGISQGTIWSKDPEIVLYIFGPRGGMRTIDSLHPREALKLGHALINAAGEEFCTCHSKDHMSSPYGHVKPCPLAEED